MKYQELYRNVIINCTRTVLMSYHVYFLLHLYVA